MPELPEVETIVRQLKKRLVGKKINSVDIVDRKLVDAKVKKIVLVRVVSVKRRAKSIIIELEKEQSLLIQLRMTGHFHYVPKGKSLNPPYEKFVVARFYLSDGSLLTHSSVRRFGSVKLLNREQLERELSKLGPEPLGKELTLNRFKEMLLRKKKANIKTTLMDQKFLAGVGNIYAQEALYHARIDPRRKIGSLSDQEIQSLYNQLRRVLELAVKHHGTTVETYVHIEGSGGFQKHLVVYGRGICPKKHKLRKINLGGRGTYYCPLCQK